MELPPRARRILKTQHTTTKMLGTTSACAENTQQFGVTDRIQGNYLRVRGEYRAQQAGYTSNRELPPRARRIPENPDGFRTEKRTTSACAENTIACRQRDRIDRNYLRVRGEYQIQLPTTNATRGTTSACAENTRHRARRAYAARNYLRVRGEYLAACTWLHGMPELPPRARRIRIV